MKQWSPYGFGGKNTDFNSKENWCNFCLYYILAMRAEWNSSAFSAAAFSIINCRWSIYFMFCVYVRIKWGDVVPVTLLGRWESPRYYTNKYKYIYKLYNIASKTWK